MTTNAEGHGDALNKIRQSLVQALSLVDELLAPRAPTTSEDLTALPRTRAIEAILAKEERPMRPAEIRKGLLAAGRTDPAMEVQVTTYDLWRRGRLIKLGVGDYCHPLHVPPGSKIVTFDS
jgi:hypothetical protein